MLNSTLEVSNAVVRIASTTVTTNQYGAFMLAISDGINDVSSYAVFATTAFASTYRIITSNSDTTYCYCTAIKLDGSAVSNTELNLVYVVVYKK